MKEPKEPIVGSPTSLVTYHSQQIGSIVLMVAVSIVLWLSTTIAMDVQMFFFYLLPIPVAALFIPCLMLLTTTPPLTIDEEGLILRPFLGRQRRVYWHEIEELQTYTMLPMATHETARRALAGEPYTVEQGLLLIIPKLPYVNRLMGWYAGAGWRPGIIVTNRTHNNYIALANCLEDNIDRQQDWR